MNTRHIVTKNSWFGGGMDITPTDLKSKESEKLAEYFHKNIKKICEENQKGSYKKFKKWCDEYFYLPHRGEPRGLGGIFYDYLNSDNWETDFEFTRKVGITFIDSYKNIVVNTKNVKWNEKDKKNFNITEGQDIQSLIYFMTEEQNLDYRPMEILMRY